MKALQFHHHGEPESVIEHLDRPAPPLSSNQVRVRMIAAPINPSDLNYICGGYGKSPDQFPAIPGFEGVGKVVEGSGLLGKLLVGRRVATLTSDFGSWAEETVVDARRAIPVPSDLSDDQAAMFFINPATAWLLTQKLCAIKKGQWLLQTGGSSQVGKMVIRLGKHLGFHTVSIVRDARHIEPLRALGATAVVVHTDDSQDPAVLLDQIRDATRDAHIPAAIDCVGGSLGSTVLKALAPGGKLIVYGTLSNQPLHVPSRVLMTADRSLHGFWLGPWMASASLLTKLKLIKTLSRLHRAGLFHTEVVGKFGLNEFQSAFQNAGQASGKVLFTMAPST
jgi:NADPH2:quinone reductase